MKPSSMYHQGKAYLFLKNFWKLFLVYYFDLLEKIIQ